MIKRALKPLLALALALAARAVLRRYRPRVVMVTGSVGKTSTKDAVAEVLVKRYLVRKSEKNLNTEFGVPYTVLGVPDPRRNLFAWLGLAKRVCALLFLPNHYPNMLVLEVGAERPGDLADIVRIAPPDAVVVTRLPEISVHVEFYESPESVREEEFSPAYALPASAPLIVSADDPYAYEMATRTPARRLSYGFAPEADVRIVSHGFCEEGGEVSGMRAELAIFGERASAVVRGSVGKVQLLPAAAAIAIAVAFDIAVPEALEALAGYVPPSGRGRLLRGVNGTLLVDDSYNASPAAVEEALATLRDFPHAKRRIAVLGDMLELGRYSVMEHERIGAGAAFADLLVSVGVRARGFAEAARAAGMPESRILSFDDSHAAATALAELLKAGDVVLIKGSQSIRTERIAKALLADPADASKLVRQESSWVRRA